MDLSSGNGAPKAPVPEPEPSVRFDALDTAGSLEADALDSVNATGALNQEAATDQYLLAREQAKTRTRRIRFSLLALAILIGIGLIVFFSHRHPSAQPSVNADASQKYAPTSIPLANIGSTANLGISNNQVLSINGQLNVNNALVLAPTKQPSGAVTGQLYYDQNTNHLTYFNGQSFVSVLSQSDLPAPQVAVTSLGQATGNVSLGSGLNMNGNTLSNSGVLTIQGESGNISLVGGSGIAVNGTTLSNTGILNLGGATGAISLGTGLSLNGNTLNATVGVKSITGTGDITVTNDGNGNYTIGSSGTSGTGTVTSPGGTSGKLAVFDGVQDIADSLVSQAGTVVSVSGDLQVSGALSLGTPLAVADGGTGATSVAGARSNLGAAANGANSDITSLSGLTTALSVAQGGTGVGTLPTNSVLIGNGTSGLASVVAGTSGLCLVSTAGAPTFQTCPGSGGVASLNGLVGAISIADATASGSTITIQNASTSQRGLASFDSTNFTVSGGAVNTVQNISTTAAPTFGQLTLTSSQATNPMLLVNNTNLAATGALLDLQVNGTSKFSVTPGGNISTTGTLNGQTISSNASFTGSVAIGTTLNVNTITPTSTLTIGASGQSFLLQGNASSTFTATSGVNTTTIGFQSPTANVTYNFPAAVAGTYNICTTAGNCAGVGGGVTTTGGTNGTIAKFTGSGTIANSIITDNGSTVTIGGALSVNTITPTSALSVGAAGQNLTLQGAVVNLSATSGGVTNTLTFATPSGANKAITLPDASGTVAVSASGPLALDNSGNLTCPTCLTSGGGGGTAGVASLNGLTGALLLQGGSAGSITASGSTITINDASGTVKGLASFNTTNLTVTSGNVNTVQDIAITSTPTFAGLNLTTALSVTNGGTGATSASGARSNLGAAASGANSDITSLSGLTTALSVAQGGTGLNSLIANQLLYATGTTGIGQLGNGSTGQCLVSNGSGTAPSFQTCTGAGGVSSVDGLNGALTISNTTGAGSTITINNAKADGSTKGIAMFSSTNFADNGSGLISIKTGGVTSTEIADGTIINSDLAGGTYSAITGTGGLTTGSIGSGFGTISTTNTIATTAALQGGTATLTGANTLALGTSSTNDGSIKFFSSLGSGSVTLSLQNPGTTTYTLSIPTLTANATICTDNSICNGYASVASLAGYIQLQGSSPGSAQTGNFNITGVGIASTALQAPSFDTPSAGTLSIGGTNATTVNLATNGAAHTIAIGNGAAAQTITIGSTTSTSALTLQAGTGNVNLVTNSASAGVAVLTQTNSATAFSVQNTSSASVFNVDTSTNTVTVGISTAVGGAFINNGSTLNAALALGDFPSGGAIGTAAATVDTHTAFTVNQATSGQTLSLPNPTVTTAGRIVYLANIGSVSFSIVGTTLSPGTNASFLWNGSSWTATAVSTGVTIVGSLNGGTVNANGAYISGNTIYLQSATGSFAGLVSTTTQTFAGNKTFSGNLTVNAQTILGKNINQVQLIVKGSASQTAANPLIMLEDNSGNELARINADSHSNFFAGNSVGGYNSTGASNTALGTNAFFSNTTGSNNIAVGAYALYNNGSGSGNVAIGTSALNGNGGNSAGSYNTALGYDAGYCDTASYCTTSNLQSSAAFGAYAQVQANNTIVIGRTDVPTQIVIGATVPVGSNSFGVSPIDINSFSSSITASQTGSGTITASAAIFSASNVGEELVWADGTTETITGYTDSTHVTGSSSSITETSSYFRTHHIGFQVTNTGNAYVQNTSTIAFQVQNATGTQVLGIDTANGAVLITSTGNSSIALKVTDSSGNVALVVDAGNKRVGINTGSPGTTLSVNGGNNISAAWPDGLVGTPVAQSVTLSVHYTVPTGYTLYLTSFYSTAGNLTDTSNYTYAPGTTYTSFANPIPVLAGEVLELNASGTGYLTGLLVPAAVTPAITMLVNTSAYSIPAGKTFYITGFYGQSSSTALTDSTGNIYTVYTTGSTASFGIRIPVAGGAVLKTNSSNPAFVSGYFTNSNGLGGP